MEKGLPGRLCGLGDHRVEACKTQMEVDPSTDEDDKTLAVSNRRDMILSGDNAVLEPREGMEFDSEEVARTFYSTYAGHVGFCIRISKYSRSRRDNSVISRRFVCSKEGFRELRVKNGLFGEQRRQRAVTRVGCKAMIMVKKMSGGKWIVTRFVKEHNHGPVPATDIGLTESCEDNNSKIKPLVSREDQLQEPFEGMEFESEEAVKTFYSIYAMHMGFRARISKYCRSRRDNSIISRQIVCSKEGFREAHIRKEIGDKGRTRCPRLITRIGCKAMIAVRKLNPGKWVVTKFEKEHNHALGISKNVLPLQSNLTSQSLLALQVPSPVHNLLMIGDCTRVQGASQDTLTILYNHLCHEAIKYAQEGAVSEEIYNVAMSALKEAVEKVASAKRSAAAAAQSGHPGSRTNEEVSMGENAASVIRAETKASRNKQSECKLKTELKGQELVLLQGPIKFVSIQSASANAPSSTMQSMESSLILSLPDDQKSQNKQDAKHASSSSHGLDIMSPVEPVYYDSSNRRKNELRTAASGDVKNTDTNQESKKLDILGLGPTHSTASGLSEAQLVAIPAVPATLCMPSMESEAATFSDPVPGTPSNPSNPCTLVDSAQSAAAILCEVPSPVTTSISPPDHMKLYTGPNPQVHATALAVGARILPRKAAASLIKAVESRIKSAGATVAILPCTDNS